MAKLTEADVAAIRAAFIPYHKLYGCAALGRAYGVSTSQISRITRRVKWKVV